MLSPFSDITTYVVVFNSDNFSPLSSKHSYLSFFSPNTSYSLPARTKTFCGSSLTPTPYLVLPTNFPYYIIPRSFSTLAPSFPSYNFFPPVIFPPAAVPTYRAFLSYFPRHHLTLPTAPQLFAPDVGNTLTPCVGKRAKWGARIHPSCCYSLSLANQSITNITTLPTRTTATTKTDLRTQQRRRCMNMDYTAINIVTALMHSSFLLFISCPEYEKKMINKAFGNS